MARAGPALAKASASDTTRAATTFTGCSFPAGAFDDANAGADQWSNTGIGARTPSVPV
jgi:hypothetical protein